MTSKSIAVNTAIGYLKKQKCAD